MRVRVDANFVSDFHLQRGCRAELMTREVIETIRVDKRHPVTALHRGLVFVETDAKNVFA